MSDARPKSAAGPFFEDFSLGQKIAHAARRRVGEGERALYQALAGGRFALAQSDVLAKACGLPGAPLDDLLAFHLGFGLTVPEISHNATANLGYADCRFAARLYPGDELRAESEVVGLREVSSGEAGVVYVRSRILKGAGEEAVTWARWVMVPKRDPKAPAPPATVPDLPESAPAEGLALSQGLDLSGYARTRGGELALWEDYQIGEKIDHLDGQTVEAAEHQMAARLYQNTARVHTDQLAAAATRLGRRVVYGGHVISLARALSFNGLAAGEFIAAIHGGVHAAPVFAGDTITAWSEIVDKQEIAGRRDLALLRVKTVALKNRRAAGFLAYDGEGKRLSDVALELDYSVVMARG